MESWIFFDNAGGRGREGSRGVGGACPSSCSKQPVIRGNKRIAATHVAVAVSMCFFSAMLTGLEVGRSAMLGAKSLSACRQTHPYLEQQGAGDIRQGQRGVDRRRGPGVTSVIREVERVERACYYLAKMRLYVDRQGHTCVNISSGVYCHNTAGSRLGAHAF